MQFLLKYLKSDRSKRGDYCRWCGGEGNQSRPDVEMVFFMGEMMWWQQNPSWCKSIVTQFYFFGFRRYWHVSVRGAMWRVSTTVKQVWKKFLVKQKQLWNKGYGLGLSHFAPRLRRYRDREFFLVLPPWILGIMPDDIVKMTRDERCYLDFSGWIFLISMQGSWYMWVGIYLYALGLGLGKKLWQPLLLAPTTL